LQEFTSEIAIIGGSVGGCAAALAASKMGKKVILFEETAWIGGQFTSQAVPPDEHPWIESFGCTQSYRQFRNALRNYYREYFPLTAQAKSVVNLNPGNGSVSRLCAEPRSALTVFMNMLAPYLHNGRLTILTKHKAVSAETDKNRIRSVTIRNLESGTDFVITAPYFLDATECGDLLPLAGVEYITGSESRAQTSEPHALDGESQPLDIQAFTYCFAMDYLEGEDHTIEKPQNYSFWRNYKADFWPDLQLSWTAPDPIRLTPVEYTLFPGTEKYPLFIYRRLIDKSNFRPGAYSSDITLVNWPQNDYWLGSAYDVSEDEITEHLGQAKQLSLSLLYWLQTEAPRHDGKIGYPGLRLRKDVVGTEDGLAMYPYIRESRRIKAAFTVLEQHISAAIRGDKGAEKFADSVGIGCYRIDLHPSIGQRNFLDVSSHPFQIPLGSFIPVRMENMLPACKNIGTTHITNGCYRLHPVEWNIGEAAGYLAAHCLERSFTPREVYENSDKIKEFQSLLLNEGIELEWPVIHAV
jgi:hypothetical protein